MPAIDLLLCGAKKLGIELDSEAARRFELFTERLLAVNQVMNLTAITDPDEVMIKHHLDSLTPLTAGLIPDGAKLVDVGCGAGFPGLPLKIARPDIEITMLDSLNKRIAFLQETTALLKLDRVNCVHARAEDAGSMPDFRERFDAAISRAVAYLPVLAEYCLPFVRVGGVFIAMKGPQPEQEAKDAENAIKLLGGYLEKVVTMTLPDTDIAHTLIVIKKQSTTPKSFPRSAAKIKKSRL